MMKIADPRYSMTYMMMLTNPFPAFLYAWATLGVWSGVWFPSDIDYFRIKRDFPRSDSSDTYVDQGRPDDLWPDTLYPTYAWEENPLREVYQTGRFA